MAMVRRALVSFPETLGFHGTTPGGAATRPTAQALRTESFAGALSDRPRAVRGGRAARAVAGNKEYGTAEMMHVVDADVGCEPTQQHRQIVM